MDSMLELELQSYNTNHSNRGIAVVINDSENRDGWKKDLEAVETVLQKLKFDVRTFCDKTKDEIRDALRNVSKEDHTENDCLVIVAMAHGNNDKITLQRSEMHIDDLWTDFVGNDCPTLTGKPKLVFIQSCRGNKHDYLIGGVKVDAVPPPEKPICVEIPMYGDLLVMYSSYDQYVSYRDKEEGSWFIQSLCQVLGANIAGKDLFTLLTHVSYLVSVRSFPMESEVNMVKHTGVLKQIPSINSMLRKVFYFVDK
uniref:Caspase family p20 domain-containing protein n=1 Tax=Anopheles melas TaxID=34690 RepID=A0A182TGV5_9DIPT